MFYPFVGSNGGTIQAPDDTVTLTNPQTEQALSYLMRLINADHVAPSAADTNSDGDVSRDQFLSGWGIATMLAGPKGRVSVRRTPVAADCSRPRSRGTRPCAD